MLFPAKFVTWNLIFVNDLAVLDYSFSITVKKNYHNNENHVISLCESHSYRSRFHKNDQKIYLNPQLIMFFSKLNY